MTEGSIDPPWPMDSPRTNFFWEGANQRKLLIQRCQDCGHYIHYPRPICNRCWSTRVAPSEVSGRGTVYTYTTVMQALHPYFVDKLPYVVATIELEEQAHLHLVGMLVDCTEDEVTVGIPVQVVFRELAPDYLVPQFVLAA